MAKNQKSKLEQTKGSFKLRGEIVGFNDESVREGETKKEVPYKSIRFGVKTNQTNTVYPELFGMEKSVVKGFNRNWEQDGVEKIIDVDWEDRHNMPNGYQLLGTNLTLENDTKGKGIRKTMVEMDAIDYMAEHLSNGDSVYVNGTLDFSEYENRDGDVKEQTRFSIGGVTRTKDIDFEDEKFEELCSFMQEIVVNEVIVDKKAQKVFISAFIISYKGEAINATFTVDAAAQPKLANKVAKDFKFGDLVKIYGEIKSGFVTVATTADEEDEWGGKVPNGYKGKARENIFELLMTGVAKDEETGKALITKGKYKQEDFEKEEAEKDFGETGDDDSKPNPFNAEDDDLPF